MADLFSDIGGFLGAIVGDYATQEERDRQRRAIEEERRLYATLPTTLNPETEALYELDRSGFEDIREDPLLRGEQLRTMMDYRRLAEAGGLDPQSRAALAETQAAAAGQERAQRGSILDEFARRGGGGGNSALLAALTAQQGSAQRAGMEGLRSAGMADANRRGALAAAAGLAGDVRGQDYRLAGDRASAMDRVAAYNAANRQQVAARNTDRRTRASEGNIGREYERARLQGGTYGGERDFYEQQERRKRGLWAGGGQAVGTGVGYAVGAPGDPFAGAGASGSYGWG